MEIMCGGHGAVCGQERIIQRRICEIQILNEKDLVDFNICDVILHKTNVYASITVNIQCALGRKEEYKEEYEKYKYFS